MQPIFKIQYSTVIRMNAENLSEIIEYIQSKKYQDPILHPVSTLHSVRYSQNCQTCSILKEVCDDMHHSSQKQTQDYNQLLNYVNKLIEKTVDVLNDNHLQCQQLRQEIEVQQQMSQQKDLQMKMQIKELQNTIQQLRFLLLEKHQQMSQMEERKSLQSHQRSFVRKRNKDLQGRCQLLSNHKRQKSQQCTRLQSLNMALQQQKIRLLHQNRGLLQQIQQLKDYVIRMEQDMTQNNIRSPRMINERERTFPDLHNNSIEEQSSIQGSSSQNNKSVRQYHKISKHKHSVSSSFVGNRHYLREILNISGQSSKFFQFRTLERAQMRQHSSGNSSNENDINTENIIKNDDKSKMTIKSSGDNEKIKQIKQFQVEPQKENTEQKHEKPSVNIDPYFAFFTLTIQCIKLNWGNLNEVANIDLSAEWDQVQKVPFNDWNNYLFNRMKQECQVPVQ